MTVVTGAAGFAGGHLLDRLAGRTRLTAWHRPGHLPAHHPPDVTWQAVDLVDKAGVRRAIESAAPSRIYHLAGNSRVDTAWQDVVPHLQANVLGTHYLLEAVRQVGAPCRIVIITSATIYQMSDQAISEDSLLMPSSPYGLSKLAEDELARRAVLEDGMDVVLARPFNHAGPRQNPGFVVSSLARQFALIEAGRAAPDIRVGNLDARRDFTDVRDVCEAYEHLMETAPAGRPFNICSGWTTRVGELVDAFVSLTRANVHVTSESTRFRPSDVPVILGDSARIRTELGWVARIPIERTIEDTLDWWRTEVGAGR
jgi:GDP-4-dehydro-6-deoxy-D-mannose reductase